MSPQRMIKISKYLGKHLRHNPERIGLTLTPGGWVEVDALLDALQKARFDITRDELNHVVDNNDKQRFSFDETGTRIRANQGHSVAVDLELTPQDPPALLYHGTGEKNLAAIQERGLLKMARHHVHLSAETETARKVGQRHGKPVVFRIQTERMMAADVAFYCSENGVWLVDHVPPEYIDLIDDI